MMLCITSLSAQTLINSSIDITAGYTPDGYAINANYNIVFDPSYMKLGMYVSSSKEITTENYEIPYSIFSVNAGYFYPLITSNNQIFVFSAGGGVLAGYEIVNNGSKELPNGSLIDSQSNFIYGGFATGELEIGITNRFYILAKATEYYHLNSDLGAATFYGGIGARFYIN